MRAVRAEGVALGRPVMALPMVPGRAEAVVPPPPVPKAVGPSGRRPVH